jgi:hypothetical protein
MQLNSNFLYCSASPDSGITAEQCKEVLFEIFEGRTHLLNSFHHFLQACDPFHDELPPDPLSFLAKVKVMLRKLHG